MEYKFDPSRFDTTNDPELEEILTNLYDAYDRLMIYLIKKETGYNVSIVDDEHISIDGEIFDNDQFEMWLDEHYPLYGDEDENEPRHYDA